LFVVVAPVGYAVPCCRHNPNSKKSQVIAGIPNVGLCQRCHDIIEWRKKFRKYKPIKNLTKWCAPISPRCNSASLLRASYADPCGSTPERFAIMLVLNQHFLDLLLFVLGLAQCVLRREEGPQRLPSVVH
jgi:hypothetical protein